MRTARIRRPAAAAPTPIPALAGVLSWLEEAGEVVGEAVGLLDVGAGVLDGDVAVEDVCDDDVDVDVEEDASVEDEDVLALAEEVIVLCGVEDAVDGDEDDADDDVAAVDEVGVAIPGNAVRSGQPWTSTCPVLALYSQQKLVSQVEKSLVQLPSEHSCSAHCSTLPPKSVF